MRFAEFQQRFPVAAAGILQAARQHRLAPAYLISGDVPSTRLEIARLIACTAGCLHPGPEGMPCGECRVCRQIENSEYAELYELSASSKTGEIKVGDPKNPELNTMRWFEAQFHLTSTAGNGLKFGIIHDADRMNSEAQNAFLKTLEEPPPGTTFLLTTGNPAALLATTRSRCQLLPVLENRVAYDFPGADELKTALDDLFFGSEPPLRRAAAASDRMLAAFSALAGGDRDGADEEVLLWQQRLEQAEAMEDKALAKRLKEQQEGAAASAYLKRRDEAMSLIHAYCAELTILALAGDRAELPGSRLVPEPLPHPVSRKMAEKALAEAEKWQFRLRFTVDEGLAARSFALNAILE